MRLEGRKAVLQASISILAQPLRSTHPTRYSVIVVVAPISIGARPPPAIAGPGPVRSAPTTVAAAPVAVVVGGAMRRNPTALPLVPITWDGMPAPTALSPHAHDTGCWTRRGRSSLPSERNSISGDGRRQTETPDQDQS